MEASAFPLATAMICLGLATGVSAWKTVPAAWILAVAGAGLTVSTAWLIVARVRGSAASPPQPSAEAAQQASAEPACPGRHEQLIESIDLAVSLIDAEHRVVDMNPAMGRLFQVSPGKALRKPCYEVLRGRSDTCLDCPGTRAMVTGKTETAEFSCRLPDGRTAYLKAKACPHRDRSGQVRGFVESVEDITSRRQAFRNLQGSIQFLRVLLDTMPNPVFYVDAGRRYAGCNRAFCEQIAHRESEEIIGQLLGSEGDPLPASVGRLHQPTFDKLLAGGGSETFHARLRSDDGPTSECLFQAAAYYGSDPTSPAGVICVIEDLSEHLRTQAQFRQAKEEAEQANAELESAIERANHLAVEAQIADMAKTEFLANVSHEIRTPLNGIVGMTALLMQEELTDGQRELTETIRTCSDELLDVINDILDFSKVEVNALDLNVTQFNLHELLEQVVDTFGGRAKSKGLATRCHIAGDVPHRLCGDPGRIRQILGHLLSNAVKFTDTGSVQIAVELDEQSEHMVRLRLSVTDTGIGIDPERIEGLFEPFSQADSSSTRARRGTGLGLSICRHIVRLMRGRIGATSQPGQGSTFWFTAELEMPADNDEPVPQGRADESTEIQPSEAGASSAPAGDDAPAETVMPEGAAPSRKKVLDVRALLDRLEGDRQMARELLDQFLEYAPSLIRDIRQACQEEDLALLRRHAHSLKGSAATIGAMCLADLALRVQEHADAGDLAAASKMIPQLAEQLQHLRAPAMQAGL